MLGQYGFYRMWGFGLGDARRRWLLRDSDSRDFRIENSSIGADFRAFSPWEPLQRLRELPQWRVAPVLESDSDSQQITVIGERRDDGEVADTVA